MEHEETRNNEYKFAEKCRDTSCFGGQGIAEMIAKGSKGMSASDNSRSMMAGCIRMCRWFPLVPVIFGIVFLLLCYYLDASIIRVLWMIAARFVVLMGIFGFLMMSLGKKVCC